MIFRLRMRRVSIVAATVGALLVLPMSAAAAECTRNPEAPPAEAKLPKGTKPITLAPDLQAEVVNFGGKRGKKEIDFVFDTSRPLPAALKPGHLALDVPRRWKRADTSLETVLFPRPRYTEPVFKRNRTQITFTACIDSEEMPPGAFVGQTSVSGPKEIKPASVAIVVNARDGKLFWKGLAVALGAALLLIVYGRTKEVRDKRMRETNNKVAWRAALAEALNDFGFWIETTVALVAAGLAAGGVYAQDQAWGDDAFPSIVALGGTTLAAAGVQGLIAKVRGTP